MYVRAPLPKPRAAAASASARAGGRRAEAVAAASASSSAGCRQSAATASTSTAAWAAAVRGAAVCSAAVVAAVRAGAAAVSAATAAAPWAAAVDALAAAAPLEDAIAGVRRARRTRPGPRVAAVRSGAGARAADAGLSSGPWLDVVPLKNIKAKAGGKEGKHEWQKKRLASCKTLAKCHRTTKPQSRKAKAKILRQSQRTTAVGR